MKIAIETRDGGVSIMTVLSGANSEECLDKWKELHGNSYVSHQTIPANKIPQSREHRSAWKLSSDKGAVDLDPVRKRAIDDAGRGNGNG